ncbi:MAG: DUF4932 domain-containing protein, partial [Candidatus Aminicenantaceae bacterium]
MTTDPMRTMSSRIGIFVILACASIFCAPSGRPAGPEVRVDPRIELLSIIFRLAGNPEYNRGAVQSYVDDVEARFGPFREHAVVEMARELRETRGVSFDAVMSMAIHVKGPYTLEEEIAFEPRPASLEGRWRVEEAREFLEKARDFVRVTDFKGFVADHEELYETTAERMQAVMDENEVEGWFNGFFGSLPDARFSIVLGLLNGGGSYGPKVVYPDGREDLYTILGVWMTDEGGVPRFNDRVLGTVVHEFSHSFANPVVDRHADELLEAGQAIFPLVEEEMRSMAYSSWRIMMSESLVRASVVRWDLAKNGREAADKRIAWEEKNHFFWISGLSELLGEYEANRGSYPDLESFFPEIKRFFDDYAAHAEERIGRIKSRWEEETREMASRAPKIVSLLPADGARDVNPGLRFIRITFDRAMKDGAWGVMQRGGNMPRITGDV